MNKARRKIIRQQLWAIYSGHYRVKNGKKHQIAQCFYCGKVSQLSALTIDHVIPTSKGGDSDIHNLLLADRKCNQEKGDKLGMGWQWSDGRKKK
jgi:5-methylcytosine-specific restriction endonuclease McrA